jgi:hypothetical protein
VTWLLLSFRCHFNLPSVEAEEETHSKLPPIKVKFEIPYFTVSGMQVCHMAAEPHHHVMRVQFEMRTAPAL